MAKKKKILVSDVLDLIRHDGDGIPVIVNLTAYGVAYGDSYSDGMRTVQDCIEQLNSACLNAQVFCIGLPYFYNEEKGESEHRAMVKIDAEIVHD